MADGMLVDRLLGVAHKGELVNVDDVVSLIAAKVE